MSMRNGLLVAMVVIAAIIVMTVAKGMSAGTNIADREKYWTRELAGLKTGASKEELEEFAGGHGQALRCYTNGSREDQCSFDDDKSLGGSRNMPMRLAVIFVMKDDRVARQDFTTTFANAQ